MHPDLLALGYSPFFAEQMAQLPDHLRPARVTGQHRREWDVVGVDLARRAVLAGKRWAGDDVAFDEAQPTIGDWVAVRFPPDDGAPIIEHVLERRTVLARGAVARAGVRQLVVSNVDRVAIVAAFAAPGVQQAVAIRSLNPRRIERYLTATRKGGAEPLVVLHKADLVADAPARAAELAERLHGVPVVVTDAMSKNGLDALAAYLEPGQTLGFVGLSGVGKSTLVNQLVGRDAQRTSAERQRDARGRHTTTHRELFVTPGGWLLIDTPGMREFAVGDSGDADLSAFEDIVELAADCRFRDCRHAGEPGCAVEIAVREGRLATDRLDSYRSLADELRVADGRALRRGGPGQRKGKRY
ncbi:MAG TPA: ribosome small subunit-dependent GTPase A [Polyangiaceae bacterium]|nr:ribosome small subunit-dependent GTPase A [Polyangiaceae bacterium]